MTRLNDNSPLAVAANDGHMLRIVESIDNAKSLR